MSVKLFEEFARVAGQIIGSAKRDALAPDDHKQFRRIFKMGEAAQLIGISESYLRRMEKGEGGKDIPSRQLAELSGRKVGWTLDQINQIRDALDRNPYRDGRSDPCVRLAVTNFKGGVGKTTTAATVAQYLALQGYRVLCVDADPQASLTAQFFVDPDEEIPQESTLVGYLDGEIDTLEGLPLKTYWPRLDIIPANLGLFRAEFFMPVQQIENPEYRFWTRIDEGLKTIEDAYDVIILDCSPSLGYISINAIWAAHGIVVPIPPGMKDISSAKQFFMMLAETLNHLYEHEGTEKLFDFVRILVSKYDGSNAAKKIKGWVRQGFGEYVLDAEMANTTVIQVADADMNSPYELDPSSYKGSARALRRALDLLDHVNQEIEQQIRLCWPSQQAQAAQEALL